jgi:hypothetical protein
MSMMLVIIVIVDVRDITVISAIDDVPIAWGRHRD